MSIFAYQICRDALVADTNTPLPAPTLTFSNWNDEFVFALQAWRADETSENLLKNFSARVKTRLEQAGEEALLIIGLRCAELYVVEEKSNASPQNGRLAPPSPDSRLTTVSNQEAVQQFLRSMLGWLPQGQHDRDHLEAFRRAHALASEQGLTGVALNRLFQRALWLFEKVRLETDFFHSPLAVHEVLLEVAGKIFGGFKARAALIIGENAEQLELTQALQQAQIGRLYFAPASLEKLTEEHSGETRTPIREIAQLSFIDLLLFCETPEKNWWSRASLQQLMAARNHAPLLLADLTAATAAHHRHEFEKINNLFHFRRQDLTRMIEQNTRTRRQVEAEVAAWIQQEVEQFYQWHDSEDRFHFGAMVGRSRHMQRVFELIARIAQTDITVLLEGESGTGKELVARGIHQASSRARRVFIPVNCGALPENLLESELFGHMRGAFTGAINHKPGLFEEANNGTIFLDEIGEMSPALQVKLLRFLQDGEIKRVGSNAVVKADVRVLAATNRHLLQMVEEGKFRRDLYYRLNVINIVLPPLRERPEDVEILAPHFLRKYAGRMRKTVTSISMAAMAQLKKLAWPGNVRELENVIERAVALAGNTTIDLMDLPPLLRQSPQNSHVATRLPLKEIERQYILETVAACGGNYDEAARVLEIGRTTLWRKLKAYLNAKDATVV